MPIDAATMLPGSTGAAQGQHARVAVAGFLVWSSFAKLMAQGVGDPEFVLPPLADCVAVVAELGVGAAFLSACEERLCCAIAAALGALLRDRAARYGVFLGDDWLENLVQLRDRALDLWELVSRAGRPAAAARPQAARSSPGAAAPWQPASAG